MKNKRNEDYLATVYCEMGRAFSDPNDLSSEAYFFQKIKKTKDPMINYEVGNYYKKAAKYKKALEYYELAAKGNYASAFSQIGYLYQKGLGVQKDISKANEYFEEAKKRKDSFVYSYLGSEELRNNNVKKALELLLEGIKNKDKNTGLCYYLLGNIYSKPKYEMVNLKLAKKYYSIGYNKHHDLNSGYEIACINFKSKTKSKEGFKLLIQLGLMKNKKALFQLVEIFTQDEYADADHYLTLFWLTEALNFNEPDIVIKSIDFVSKKLSGDEQKDLLNSYFKFYREMNLSKARREYFDNQLRCMEGQLIKCGVIKSIDEIFKEEEICDA